MGRKKRRRQEQFDPTYVLSQKHKEDLENTFEKKFTYMSADDEQWSVAKDYFFPVESWVDTELMALKVELNEVKSSLSDIDINTWHFHTTSMNRAAFKLEDSLALATALITNSQRESVYAFGNVISHVRREYGPEMCTQAWCKFHEILSNFALINFECEKCISTLHICEAPGAFIASLNHYIKSRDIKRDWRWNANTLNPHYEGNKLNDMIADDKFIMNTLKHWYFGDDNSGDVMSRENLRGLIRNVSLTEKFELVTADGSIDCANNPAEQESITSQLHFCELVTGLCTLAIGGSMVIKMFTLLEQSSISTMYIMNCAFDKVTVFKPVSSKPGNSEVYVIGQGFVGLEEDIIEELISHVDPSSPKGAILKEDCIPQSFRAQHKQCCRLFGMYQTNTIQENKRSFDQLNCQKQNGCEHPERSEDDTTFDRDRLDAEKYFVTDFFVQRCQLYNIANEERIVPFKNSHQTNVTHASGFAMGHYVNRKPHTGSYSERQLDKQLSWKERVEKIKLFEVSTENFSNPFVFEYYEQNTPNNDEYHDEPSWSIVTGNQFQSVFSSRFCDASLLSLYNEFLLNRTSCYQVKGHDKLQQTYENIAKSILKERPDSSNDNISLYSGSKDSCLYKHLIDRKQFTSYDTSKEHEERVIHIVEGMDSCSEQDVPLKTHQCIKGLKEILLFNKGDDLVLQVCFPFTRMSVGVLYIVYKLFHSASVFIQTDGEVPFVYILGSNFKGKEYSIIHSSHPSTQEAVFSSDTNNGSSVDGSTEHHFGGASEKCNISPSNNQNISGCSAEKDNKKRHLLDYLKEVCVRCEENFVKEDFADGQIKKQILQFVPMHCLYRDRMFYNTLCAMNDLLLKLRINHMITRERDVT